MYGIASLSHIVCNSKAYLFDTAQILFVFPFSCKLTRLKINFEFQWLDCVGSQNSLVKNFAEVIQLYAALAFFMFSLLRLVRFAHVYSIFAVAFV